MCFAIFNVEKMSIIQKNSESIGCDICDICDIIDIDEPCVKLIPEIMLFEFCKILSE